MKIVHDGKYKDSEGKDNEEQKASGREEAKKVKDIFTKNGIIINTTKEFFKIIPEIKKTRMDERR